MDLQPGLDWTDNDGSFPLLRALPCHLIPQRRKPNLGSFESLTDGGDGFPSLLSLETSFRHPLAETTRTIGASTI
uniref:Uncharacterized protein n=1 Tax=Oryza barthii TaxID=65489 RepID=A0A0D3GND4_9ORYZ